VNRVRARLGAVVAAIGFGLMLWGAVAIMKSGSRIERVVQVSRTSTDINKEAFLHISLVGAGLFIAVAGLRIHFEGNAPG
jgi:hypothetical protein